ncbi:hypothetical protein CBR_g55864 [Chara braunii]|uniref:polyribonucleotide nucleotidyltransferase n=1 Tax=Chara braunii TaxID=69332 RepID=A0A388MDI3_CHABU|nr:hypothetical protein CBR_g55864 [Chara braunii]|eukprot:GBG92529.1 hypothetical protein CBR_g55864 [Chara braunii]
MAAASVASCRGRAKRDCVGLLIGLGWRSLAAGRKSLSTARARVGACDGSGGAGDRGRRGGGLTTTTTTTTTSCSTLSRQFSSRSVADCEARATLRSRVAAQQCQVAPSPAAASSTGSHAELAAAAQGAPPHVGSGLRTARGKWLSNPVPCGDSQNARRRQLRVLPDLLRSQSGSRIFVPGGPPAAAAAAASLQTLCFLRGFSSRSHPPQAADIPGSSSGRQADIPGSSSRRRQFPDRGDCFQESQGIGGCSISFETGKLARLTSGAVVAGMGDTKILATAACEREFDPSRTFLPLTVDYREKHFARGKIPGTFLRREGAPREREILCSRSIDRSIRPLFPPGFRYEVQITANVLCSDGDQDPDVLSINAASAALMVSDIPWNGPVAAVRIGRVGGHLVVNPDVDTMSESDLSLVYACTEGKTTMVEVQAREISNEDLAAAMHLAHSEAIKLLEPQRRLAAQVRHAKRQIQLITVDTDFYDKVKAIAGTRVHEVLRDGSLSKQERGAALGDLEAALAENLRAEGEERVAQQLPPAMEKLKKEIARTIAFGDGGRCDGRGAKDIREIFCEAGPLPTLHGSALFSRGSTEVLCTVTIGASEDAQKLDSLIGPLRKRFMVHYSFPPFAVNEVGKTGFFNRREIGHGNLAEKALLPLLPPEEHFPYSVRITSEVLASDGSSSMATVCGGSIALMDAGINLREHVAGVSIGLMTELDPQTGEVQRYQLLTDILGVEDYLGDMDFKIAGTRKGVTAIQLDIKLPGVPLHILCEALEWARAARSRILDKMEAEIQGPRTEHRASAPRYGTLLVEREHIGKLIGPQGVRVREMQEKTGAKINISSEGKVEIFAMDEAAFNAAKELLESSCGKEVEVGGRYSATVVALKDFGAFVELAGGLRGLLHISELSHQKVACVQDVLSVGQVIDVMCTARDVRGNMKFSLKALLPHPSGDEDSWLPGPPRAVYRTGQPSSSLDVASIARTPVAAAAGGARELLWAAGGERRKREVSETPKVSPLDVDLDNSMMVISAEGSQGGSVATSVRQSRQSTSLTIDPELQTVAHQSLKGARKPSKKLEKVVKAESTAHSKVAAELSSRPMGSDDERLGLEQRVRVKKLKKHDGASAVEGKRADVEGRVHFDKETLARQGLQGGEKVQAAGVDARETRKSKLFTVDARPFGALS